MAQYKIDQSVQKVLQEKHKPEMTAMIQGLGGQSEIGHLLATDYFKDNVMDLSDDFAKECATNPSYKLIKEPLRLDEIRKGHAELNDQMKENLAKVSTKQRMLDLGYTSTVDDQLYNYIKEDPSISLSAMLNAPPEKQAAFGAHMCSQAESIYKSDKRWRYAEYIAGGIGVVAGGILIATGFGAPIGAGLIAGSTTLLTTVGVVEGVSAINKYQDAKHREITNDRSMLEKRRRTDEYIEEFKKTDDQKLEAKLQGGLAVISIIPGVKALKVVTPLKTTALATRTGRGIAATDDVLKIMSKAGPKILPTKKLSAFIRLSSSQKSIANIKKSYDSIMKLKLTGQQGSVAYESHYKIFVKNLKNLKKGFVKNGGSMQEVESYMAHYLKIL